MENLEKEAALQFTIGQKIEISNSFPKNGGPPSPTVRLNSRLPNTISLEWANFSGIKLKDRKMTSGEKIEWIENSTKKLIMMYL